MLADIAAGGGIGLLLGYLLGLSVSPIVQGVVVAITGLLGAVLGIGQTQHPGRSVRIGAFGLFCVAGVTLGLAVRGGSLLVPSVKAQVTTWTRAGYSTAEARAYVAYQRLGIKPATLVTATPPDSRASSSALYAADTRSACNAIGLLADPRQRLVLARQMGFAKAANQAAESPNPSASLDRLLRCGN